MENIYDFEVQKSNGENYKLDVYKGDVMLIVNTRVNVDLHHNLKDYKNYIINIRTKDLLF